MKKGMVILVLGLLAAAVAYGCIYFVCTSSVRGLRQSNKPELAWLGEEFKLSEPEFHRVSALHAAYLPQCRDMCLEIGVHTAKLQALLSNATNMTPEIAAALVEGARLRSECQTMMLRHFFEVSNTMPPQQGARYLAWVTQKAFLPNYDISKE